MMGMRISGVLVWVVGLNLGKIQCPLALQLVCHIVFTILSMIVSSVLAWVVFIDQFRHRANFYFIAGSIKSYYWKSIFLLVSHSSVFHTLVSPISKNLHTSKIRKKRDKKKKYPYDHFLKRTNKIKILHVLLL